jgi:hypothetical protein
MALVTYPLNNIEYSAEDAELFHATRTSGIYAKDSFGYSITGTDNNIVIGTGIGWIKNGEFSGKVVAQKEPISLNMGLPDPVYPSIDAIVIQFDANKNETNIVVKKGVAATSPVAPSVVRTESVYELHLYHVRREAGSLYITAGNITDLRLNSSYCGLMADSVTKIDTATIEKQIEELIESLRGYIPPIESSDNPGCYYKLVGGEKEWLNPPVVLGVEYRTTERYKGKVVYTKLFSCGTLAAGSTNVIDTTSSGVQGIIRYNGMMETSALPFMEYNCYLRVGNIAGQLTAVINGGTLAPLAETVYAQAWYTKA